MRFGVDGDPITVDGTGLGAQGGGVIPPHHGLLAIVASATDGIVVTGGASAAEGVVTREPEGVVVTGGEHETEGVVPHRAGDDPPLPSAAATRRVGAGSTGCGPATACTLAVATTAAAGRVATSLRAGIRVEMGFMAGRGLEGVTFDVWDYFPIKQPPYQPRWVLTSPPFSLPIDGLTAYCICTIKTFSSKLADPSGRPAV